MFTKYEIIRHNLKTFDIVLFSGTDKMSAAIRAATNSDWSHVGMIVRFPQLQAIMLYESTTLSNLRDTVTGKQVEGVQLVYMRERLMTYDGDVAVRRLMFPRPPSMIFTLGEFMSEMKGRKYEQDKMELIRSAYDGPLGDNVEDFSSVFCSELVAGALKRCGILPEGHAANEYTPGDFASDELAIAGGVAGQIEYLKHREQATRAAV